MMMMMMIIIIIIVVVVVVINTLTMCNILLQCVLKNTRMKLMETVFTLDKFVRRHT